MPPAGRRRARPSCRRTSSTAPWPSWWKAAGHTGRRSSRSTTPSRTTTPPGRASPRRSCRADRPSPPIRTVIPEGDKSPASHGENNPAPHPTLFASPKRRAPVRHRARDAKRVAPEPGGRSRSCAIRRKFSIVTFRGAGPAAAPVKGRERRLGGRGVMFVEHSMNGEGGQGPGAVASGRSGTAAEQRDEGGDDQGDSDQAGGDPPAVHPKQVAAQQDPAERRHRPEELAENN